MSELRFMTAGESHGQSLTAILEGLPAGLELNLDEMNADLARRQQGYGRGGRMKIEKDSMDIVSGVRFGQTIGSPVTVRVANRDWANWTERMAPFGEESGEKVTAARPGHADMTGYKKYNRLDVRDILERSSARETTMRVAVGALCKQLLKSLGIEVVSHVIKIGGVGIDYADAKRSKIGKTSSDLNCIDEVAEAKMKERIHEAKKAGDTVGGVFEVIVRGVPLGLGSHIQWDKRLDGILAGAMMSVQAIKGVEIGAGFLYGELFGSELHDEMFVDGAGSVYRKTNNAGGLEGGMTNGEDIVIRAVMKPIPTLMTPLSTVDVHTGKAVKASTERSDVCAVGAASVVGEAMTAFVIARAICDKFGSDALIDMQNAIKDYKKRIESRA